MCTGIRCAAEDLSNLDITALLLAEQQALAACMYLLMILLGGMFEQYWHILQGTALALAELFALSDSFASNDWDIRIA